MDLAKIRAPFAGNKINFRVGATTKAKDKGIAFAYLDARDVMERLDEVCGVTGWQARYPFPGCCEIGIQVAYQDQSGTVRDWIWKANGAGETDVEAEKGMYSDAFKRAAVLWGIGRYLYDMPNVWLPIEPQGKSYGFSRETKAQLVHRYDAWVENYFKQLGEQQ